MVEFYQILALAKEGCFPLKRSYHPSGVAKEYLNPRVLVVRRIALPVYKNDPFPIGMGLVK